MLKAPDYANYHDSWSCLYDNVVNIMLRATKVALQNALENSKTTEKHTFMARFKAKIA